MEGKLTEPKILDAFATGSLGLAKNTRSYSRLGVVARHIYGTHRWQLETELTCTVLAEGFRPRSLEVPKGFTTDLATLPRLGRVLLRSGGRIATAAVIHDWLYQVGELYYSRKNADVILYHLCRDSDINAIVSRLVYWGVRVGGWYAWRKHVRRRDN